MCPIHLDNHWTLIVIDVEKTIVFYIDSLKGSGREVLNKIRTLIEFEAEERATNAKKRDIKVINNNDLEKELLGENSRLRSLLHEHAAKLQI